MSTNVVHLHQVDLVAGYMRVGLWDQHCSKVGLLRDGCPEEKKRLASMSEILTDMLADAPVRSRSRAPCFRGNNRRVVVLGQGA